MAKITSSWCVTDSIQVEPDPVGVAIDVKSAGDAELRGASVTVLLSPVDALALIEAILDALAAPQTRAKLDAGELLRLTAHPALRKE